MKRDVVIVDYGMGNLFSVARAFAHCGCEARLADSPQSLQGATHLVLPGVGAFADGMAGLRDRALVEPILRFAYEGKPMLGICLGMQMMMDESEEFGRHEGLGLIPGRVAPVPRMTVSGEPQKIPHIGWNRLVHPKIGGDWNGSVLSGLEEGAAVYFVHSFMALPEDPGHRLADCLYGERRVTAAIRSGKVFGCQFHPEKSGEVGLSILRKFLELDQ